MPVSERAIQAKLAAGGIEYSVHAILEAAADLVFVNEIEHSLRAASIIEDYPDRSRCLACGPLPSGGLLHVVVEYADWLHDSNESMVVTTVYRPDPRQWIDGRARRR